MIQCSGLSKEFAGRILFNNITFNLDKGEKVGLVGRNGTGKSTLFQIIMGKELADEGIITVPKHYRIGMLEQHLSFKKDTVLAECMQVLPDSMQFDEYRAQAILNGLGFSDADFKRSPLDFSGGYQIRINLAKLLLQGNDLLLLDEPTNYLDIVSMRWLEKFLCQFSGEFILITHDREFMNKVTNNIMGLHRQKLLKVHGNFSQYQLQLQEEERIYENTRQNQEKRRKEIEAFVNKFRAKARQASLAQSRQKMLEKMEEFEKLEDVSGLHFKFNYKEMPAKSIFNAEQLSFGYQASELLFKNLSFHLDKGECLGIIGKNGKGKSTLLNVIAKNLQPLKGEVNFHHATSIGHFGQTNIDTLNKNMTVEQEIANANNKLGTTIVRSICGTMMFSGDDSQKKISVLSGGEKSRVLLGKILATDNNLLLLDEPTNHLDQESIESLVNELQQFPGGVVLVTHSEMLLRELATKLVVFHRGTCEFFQGNYNEFLEKIGWEDDFIDKKNVPEKEKVSRKDYKRLRSELINERSRATKEPRKKVETLEAQIMDWESELELVNDELVIASTNEDAQAITDYSQKLSDLEGRIEKAFNELEKVSEHLHQVEQEFELKLNKLESLT